MLGAGTLILGGSNTYSGGTTIGSGTLQLGNAAAIGSTSGAATISGGVLDLHGYSIGVGALSGGNHQQPFRRRHVYADGGQRQRQRHVLRRHPERDGQHRPDEDGHGHAGPCRFGHVQRRHDAVRRAAQRQRRGRPGHRSIDDLRRNDRQHQRWPIGLAANNTQTWSGNFTFAGANDLNLGAGAVTMSGSRTVTVASNNLTVGGPISGSGYSLTKAGSGTLTLAGSSTYTGGTTVGSGTLQLGDGASKNGSVAGNISDNARLIFANPKAQTYTGAISGSGSVTRRAPGRCPGRLEHL